MNTFLLQRLTFLAVLPLCTLIVVAAARAAEPAATPDAPASAAPAPQAPEDGAHRHHRFEWHHHRDSDGHHPHGNDRVNIGHDSNLPHGETADSVVSIFGSSTIDGEAGDVVSIIGDTRVTGDVSDSAVAVLGNVYIDGKVDGDAVTVFGNMELGPHAEIDGDVVAVGGTVQRDPAAVVHGDVHNVLGSIGGVDWLRTWVRHCLLYARPLALAPGLGWAWGLAFAFLALYAGLALLFREGVTRCVHTFEAQPGRSVLAALITMLLTPVLVTLLFVTVIGIAAVPFVVFALFCAGLFGKAVMLAWLGGRVTGKQGMGPTTHPAVDVLIGGALVLILYLVPVLGFLVYKLLGLLGLGAVVYTVILAARTHQAAKEAPIGSTAPPGLAGAPSMGREAPLSGAAPPIDAAQTAGGAQASSAAEAPDPRGPAPAAAAPHAPTPPPVIAALPRAGFWIRMGALLLDALLVGFLMGVLHVYHLELPVLAAYGAMMWKLRGSTIGGIVFDLRVVRLDGREIDWETAIVRALACFLSLAVAGLGFFWIAFDDHKQAWHDKIAGTVVVRVAKGTPLV
jgi:uncharacterized RDD family membrane protein YckC/cytoskeletal protein CcmA (bactofilin family)